MDNWDWYTAHKYEAPVNTPKPLPVQKVWYEERIAALEAENVALREDAERWRMLPAFLEKHQINYVMLLRDIDAARKESGNG